MALLKWPKRGRNGAAPSVDGRRRPPIRPRADALMDHLRELRNRLVIALLGLLVGASSASSSSTRSGGSSRSRTPAWPRPRICGRQCTLLVTGVFDAFFVNLKVAAMFGLVVSSPVWLWQIWGFVTPGLYRNEKRYSMLFSPGRPLFLAGSGVAYFVMDTGLSILLGFAPPGTLSRITISEYLSYALVMLVIFGVSFELPLLMVFLNVIGVLPRRLVAKHRRMIIFIMFALRRGNRHAEHGSVLDGRAGHPDGGAVRPGGGSHVPAGEKTPEGRGLLPSGRRRGLSSR